LAPFADIVEFDAARRLTFGGQSVDMLLGVSGSGGLGPALWMPDRICAGWATPFLLIDLCNPHDRLRDSHFRGGVELNDFGDPVAYKIRKAHPDKRWLRGSCAPDRVTASRSWRQCARYGCTITTRAPTAIGGGQQPDRGVHRNADAGHDIAELFGTPQQFLKSREGGKGKLQAPR
jgi:hypothetical protein